LIYRADKRVFVDAETPRHTQEMFGLQRSNRHIFYPGDAQSDGLVFGIKRCGNEVVSGCQPQPVTRVEHGEILEMRICVADEEAREYPAQQAVRLGGNA
jgi:hypothetical protein